MQAEHIERTAAVCMVNDRLLDRPQLVCVCVCVCSVNSVTMAAAAAAGRHHAACI